MMRSAPELVEESFSLENKSDKSKNTCRMLRWHCVDLLQVSISGQALVFVVRTSGWSLISRAGMLTYVAFFIAQVSSFKTCDLYSRNVSLPEGA